MKNATLKQGGNICVLEIYYKDGLILNPADRLKLEQIINENMPKGFDYEIRFVKNFINADSILPEVEKYFENNCPAILHRIDKVETDNGIPVVYLSIDEKSFDRFENKRICPAIIEYLTNYFCHVGHIY